MGHFFLGTLYICKSAQLHKGQCVIGETRYLVQLMRADQLPSSISSQGILLARMAALPFINRMDSLENVCLVSVYSVYGSTE